MSDKPWEEPCWQYATYWVFAGGGAKHPDPQYRGFVVLTEEGVSVEPDDGYYSGTLTPEQSIELAVAVLRKFAPGKLKGI